MATEYRPDVLGIPEMDVKSVDPKGSLLFNLREMRWNF